MLVDCSIAGLIGILIHVFVVKVPSLQTRFRKANVEFSIRKFFQSEWVNMIASLLTVVAFVFTLDEILSFRPELAKAIKWLFIFVGFTGSSIIMALFSKTAKYLNSIIDFKTDKADGKVETT